MTEKCTQCDRPAMYSVDGHLLCLSCYQTVEQIEHAKFTRLAVLHNQLAASIENSLGIPGFGVPKMAIPPAPQSVSIPVTNSFVFTESTIGTVNTGTIQHLQSTLQVVQQQDEQLSKLVHNLIERIAESDELNEDERREAIELMSVVTDEIAAPSEHKRPHALKTALRRIGEVLTPAASLASIWSSVLQTVQA